MDQQYQEIMEIPAKALGFLKSSPKFKLPLRVPYLGMGSSYFAPLAFKHMGVDIQPELASEYFNYPVGDEKKPAGVILSQSGRSTEALWCTRKFEKYIAVTNYAESPLCAADNAAQVVLLLAGDEKYSSSNTYVNTLLVLFQGLGLQAAPAVDLLIKNMTRYEALGRKLAEDVFALLTNESIHGIYITGSGPNIATAMQAALILSESTKLNFNGLPMAQYDHGPKETAKNSIVIQIQSAGPSYQRTTGLSAKIANAGARVFTVEEPEATEHFSILHNIIPFNFMAYYLAKHLNVGETFTVGGKVTEVN